MLQKIDIRVLQNFDVGKTYEKEYGFNFGMISKHSVMITAFAMNVLFVIPECTVAAAPATPGGMEYDIPISELNKIKKEPPAKRVAGESKKKKKVDAKPRGAAADTEAAADSNAPAAAVEKIQVAVEPPPKSVRIHHIPYSFVVAGRRTVIQAVINSEVDVQTVSCKIRVVEGGAQAVVKMIKVSGTRFTYEATLPGLTPEIPTLRYVIIAVDPSGKETISQEFVTPVTASSVVPGWQIENTGGAIQLELKDTKKPGL